LQGGPSAQWLRLSRVVMSVERKMENSTKIRSKITILFLIKDTTAFIC